MIEKMTSSIEKTTLNKIVLFRFARHTAVPHRGSAPGFRTAIFEPGILPHRDSAPGLNPKGSFHGDKFLKMARVI